VEADGTVKKNLRKIVAYKISDSLMVFEDFKIIWK
jgi:hypothetical protein